MNVAVVLAAGAGSRWEGPDHKLSALVTGRPIVAQAVGAAVDAAIGPVLVVVGPVDLSEALAPLLEGRGVELVANPRWRAGLASSLRVGVERASERGADAVVVGLADQPAVGPEAWRRVAAAPGPIVTASFDGVRRPPVRLAREVWPLLPTEGDEGARALMRRRPDLVTAVACPGDPTDVDRVEDLDRWS